MRVRHLGGGIPRTRGFLRGGIEVRDEFRAEGKELTVKTSIQVLEYNIVNSTIAKTALNAGSR